MRKLNKTILLASTLFLSSTLAPIEKVFAEEEISKNEENAKDYLENSSDDTKVNDIVGYSTYSLDDEVFNLQNIDEEDLTEKVSEEAEENEEETPAETLEASEKEDTLTIATYSLEDFAEVNSEEKIDSASEGELESREATEEKSITTYSMGEEESSDVIKYADFDLDAYVKAKVNNYSGSYQENDKENKNNFEEEVYTKGINEVDGKKYYYDSQGQVKTNIKLINEDTYYEAGEDGELQVKTDSWVSFNGKIYRTDESGKVLKGISKVGDDYYNFDKDGAIDTSLKTINDDQLFMTDKTGKIINPKNYWFAIDGKTYRTGSDGKILKGLQNVNNNNYIFEKDGIMLQNREVMLNGKYYKVNQKGLAINPKNAWINYKGNKYHTNENGYIQEGIWNIDGTLYYFSENGLTGNKQITQKGITYKVDKNGIAKPVENSTKSVDKAIEWMFTARNAGLTYDMSWQGRTSDYSADCSSAVYRSLIYGGFLEKGAAIGNTETLFKLGAEGKVMYQIDESDIRYGDIFVAGYPGASAGADGHTGFILNEQDDTIIHMSYSPNSVSITPRKGYMGDGRGLPVRYYRLVGGTNNETYKYKK
ncbi:peptidoglycan amidohydrolase family protein [Anaerococcus sp. AGMB09787]|uniref:peptidoglycan amidohydrolase family protein n=1 Tax=Anaerococcus sp. AGMB09787 TaxID=2922869 RepID=UPI001FAEA511|nr:peptidoglycan amidohydrolase family protein [Anaerococcus sp. AGMB09787]